MGKFLYTDRIYLYDYDNFLGEVILPQKRIFSVGDKVEVDFNNPAIGFRTGKWGERPGGPSFLGIHCYEFEIHSVDDYYCGAVCSQLAMGDHGELGETEGKNFFPEPE